MRKIKEIFNKKIKPGFFPLWGKVFTLTLILVTAVTMGVNLASNYLFSSELRLRLQDENIHFASNIIKTFDEEVSESVGFSNSFLSSLRQQNFRERELLREIFFETHPDILFVTQQNNTLAEQASNGFILPPAVKSYIDEKLRTDLDNFNFTEVVNLSIDAEDILIGLFYQKSSQDPITVALVKPLTIISQLDQIGQNANNASAFIIDFEGNIILHPDKEITRSRANYRNIPAVHQALTNNSINDIQVSYLEEKNEFWGSVSKSHNSHTLSVVLMPTTQVFKILKSIDRINFYIFAIIFSLAFASVYMFAITLTRPIKSLATATERISNGDYNINVPHKSNDEIGLLTANFSSMAKGLAERERIKNAFGRFVNKDLAEKALKTDLQLGGELKNAAVLFSDIRSFTDMSEKMTPNELITFLNDYMSRMVTCVTATGGAVDKFIGDAIMAVWGVHNTMGNPAKAAVDCALLMRDALVSFNVKRKAQGLSPIKIGCGISFGPLVSGQMGSTDRMEHTVIGDTVNVASRLESLTKTFNVDIIISDGVYQKCSHYFKTKPLEKIPIRGKKEPQQVYIVENRIKESLDSLLTTKTQRLTLTKPVTSQQQISTKDTKNDE